MIAVRHLDGATRRGHVLPQAHLGDLVDHLRVLLAVVSRGAKELELALALRGVEPIDVHEHLPL